MGRQRLPYWDSMIVLLLDAGLRLRVSLVARAYHKREAGSQTIEYHMHLAEDCGGGSLFIRSGRAGGFPNNANLVRFQSIPSFPSESYTPIAAQDLRPPMHFQTQLRGSPSITTTSPNTTFYVQRVVITPPLRV